MSYLFIKKSVSKRKVCIMFIKKKNKKKKIFWCFLGFLGGFFIANPGSLTFLNYVPGTAL
jgi:hypothetical protein